MELRENSLKFEKALNKRKVRLNESKTDGREERIIVLGSEIGGGRVAPDEGKLKPLIEMTEPTSLQKLKRIRGRFAYYTLWIPDYSTKIKSLSDAEELPLLNLAKKAFAELKRICVGQR